MISAEIIADSVQPEGYRITSYILTYPRFIHSELMTHRVFSRNAASSRAIPVQKTIEEIRNNPARPVYWGKNQKGMQAQEELEPELANDAINVWDEAAHVAISHVERLIALNVHKQIANRLLEPWMHTKTLVTATEYNNFFALRCHKDAQPEFQCLAWKMLDVYCKSEPENKQYGEWHLPFGGILRSSVTIQEALKICTARAARLSYKTFDGDISEEKDFALHDQLMNNGHWSPFEHCARAIKENVEDSNFKGWWQYRKSFPTENKTDIDLEELLKQRRHFTYDV